jgi:hypothetical protein
MELFKETSNKTEAEQVLEFFQKKSPVEIMEWSNQEKVFKYLFSEALKPLPRQRFVVTFNGKVPSRDWRRKWRKKIQKENMTICKENLAKILS